MTRLGVTPGRNGQAIAMERLQCAAVRCVECSKGGNAGSEISQFVVTLGAEILSGRHRRWEFSHCPLLSA